MTNKTTISTRGVGASPKRVSHAGVHAKHRPKFNASNSGLHEYKLRIAEIFQTAQDQNVKYDPPRIHDMLSGRLAHSSLALVLFGVHLRSMTQLRTYHPTLIRPPLFSIGFCPSHLNRGFCANIPYEGPFRLRQVFRHPIARSSNTRSNTKEPISASSFYPCTFRRCARGFYPCPCCQCAWPN